MPIAKLSSDYPMYVLWEQHSDTAVMSIVSEHLTLSMTLEYIRGGIEDYIPRLTAEDALGLFSMPVKEQDTALHKYREAVVRRRRSRLAKRDDARRAYDQIQVIYMMYEGPEAVHRMREDPTVHRVVGDEHIDVWDYPVSHRHIVETYWDEIQKAVSSHATVAA